MEDFYANLEPSNSESNISDSIAIDENELLKIKIESLEAQLKAMREVVKATPLLVEVAKNPEVVQEIQDPNRKIDMWVGRSHIKNPA